MLLGTFVLGELIALREVIGAVVIDGRVLRWFSRASASTLHTNR
jgi:hypothetical protein